MEDIIDRKYKIINKIGKGGVGTVYKVKDIETNKIFALKAIVSSEFPEIGISRFKREFRAVQKLNHPCCIKVFDFGETDELYYYTMEYINGGTFRSIANKDYPTKLKYILKLCSVLNYIHSEKLVHRDIKPENILIGYTETEEIKVDANVPTAVLEKDLDIKLTDFGLVKTADISTYRTKTGSIVGTLAYISPEQITGKEIDGRADLYSLGVVLYELFTGRLPFIQEPDESLWSMLQKHITLSPTPPHIYNPSISPVIEKVILKLLEKEPSLRYATAEQIITELESANKVDSTLFRISEKTADIIKAPVKDYLLNPHFVNRKKEYRILKELIDILISMKSDENIRLSDRLYYNFTPISFISGETGIGKTKLVNEIKGYAEGNSIKIFSGRCYEGENPPYQPFIEILQSIPKIPSLVNRYKHSLSRLLPEIEKENTETVSSVETDSRRLISQQSDEEKLRFFNDVARFLSEYSQSNPFVIFIDDMQWGDSASFELLNYLIRFLFAHKLSSEQQISQILIFIAYQDDEPETQERLENFIHRIPKDIKYVELKLQRLDVKDGTEFIRSMLGMDRDPPTGFVKKVMEETDGNPFFVQETINLLFNANKLYKKNNEWTIDYDFLDDISIPSRVEDILRSKLDLWFEKNKEILEFAGVIGMKFHFDSLMEISSIEEKKLLDFIDDAMKRQIIVEDAKMGPDWYAFNHSKMVDIIYKKINPSRRRIIHKKVGEWLEKRQNIDEDIAELSYHFYKCGNKEKGIKYNIMAGEKFKKLYANDTAIKHYKRAVELSKDEPLEKQYKIFTSLGDLNLFIGDYKNAIAVYTDLVGIIEKDLKTKTANLSSQILNLQEDEIWETITIDDIIKLHTKIGEANEGKGEIDIAEREYKYALKLVERTQNNKLKADIFYCLGRLYARKGNFESAMQFCTKGLELLKYSEDSYDIKKNNTICTEVNLYRTLGLIYKNKREGDKSIECFLQSLKLLEKLQLRFLIASIYNDIGGTYFDIKGDIGSAELYLKKGLELFEKVGALAGTAYCYNNLGNVCCEKEDYKSAQIFYKKALDIFVMTDNQLGQALGYINLGSTYYQQKDLNEAIKYYSKSQELYESMGLLFETAIAYHNIGVCFKDQNNLDSAINSLNKAMKIYQQIEDKFGILKVSCEIADILKQKEEHKDAVEYYKIYFNTCIQLSDKNLMDDAKEKLSQLLSEFVLAGDKPKEIAKLYTELKDYNLV